MSYNIGMIVYGFDLISEKNAHFIAPRFDPTSYQIVVSDEDLEILLAKYDNVTAGYDSDCYWIAEELHSFDAIQSFVWTTLINTVTSNMKTLDITSFIKTVTDIMNDPDVSQDFKNKLAAAKPDIFLTWTYS